MNADDQRQRGARASGGRPSDRSPGRPCRGRCAVSDSSPGFMLVPAQRTYADIAMCANVAESVLRSSVRGKHLNHQSARTAVTTDDIDRYRYLRRTRPRCDGLRSSHSHRRGPDLGLHDARINGGPSVAPPPPTPDQQRVSMPPRSPAKAPSHMRRSRPPEDGYATAITIDRRGKTPPSKSTRRGRASPSVASGDRGDIVMDCRPTRDPGDTRRTRPG